MPAMTGMHSMPTPMQMTLYRICPGVSPTSDCMLVGVKPNSDSTQVTKVTTNTLSSTV